MFLGCSLPLLTNLGLVVWRSPQWRRFLGGEGILPSLAPIGAYVPSHFRANAPCGASRGQDALAPRGRRGWSLAYFWHAFLPAQGLAVTQRYVVLRNLSVKPLRQPCPVACLDKKWNGGFAYSVLEVGHLLGRNLL